MTMNIPDIEARLRARREEVEGLLETAAEDSRAVELDQTRVGRLSRMDALQGQAMAKETERRRRHELTRIDAALGRLADGSYGECLKCGQEIPEKRLAFDPAATVCVACAGG
jgi:DnaK suppressor protein